MAYLQVLSAEGFEDSDVTRHGYQLLSTMCFATITPSIFRISF